MPSNRELTEEAEKLGEELGLTVSTRYLNNVKLIALVEELRERKAALGEPPAGGSPAEPQLEPVPEVEPVQEPPTSPSNPAPERPAEHRAPKTVVMDRPPLAGGPAMDGEATTPTGGVKPKSSPYKHRYSIREGVVIVTRRGKLGAFSKIRETDLSGGLAELEQLVASGHVIKRP